MKPLRIKIKRSSVTGRWFWSGELDVPGAGVQHALVPLRACEDFPTDCSLEKMIALCRNHYERLRPMTFVGESVIILDRPRLSA